MKMTSHTSPEGSDHKERGATASKSPASYKNMVRAAQESQATDKYFTHLEDSRRKKAPA